MRTLVMTPNHLYINMVRDLYGLGQVLKTKFQLLRMSYTVFMTALIRCLPTSMRTLSCQNSDQDLSDQTHDKAAQGSTRPQPTHEIPR